MQETPNSLTECYWNEANLQNTLNEIVYNHYDTFEIGTFKQTKRK